MNLLTVPELAREIRKSVSWAYRNHTAFGSVKVGASVRIPVAGLTAYLTRSRAVDARPATNVRNFRQPLVVRALAEARHERGSR